MDSENSLQPDSDMGGIFDDATFNTVPFDSYSSPDSPFDPGRYFNLNTDSPEYQPRTPAKPYDHDPAQTSQRQHQQQQRLQQQYTTRPTLSARSAGSSSQESVSEDSSRRKRKTTSESPPTENLASLKVGTAALRSNDSMDMDNVNVARRPSRTTSAAMFTQQDVMNPNAMDMNAAFDFDSAASSPGVMDAGIAAFSPQAAMKHRALRTGNPPGTVEPAHFFMGSSAASPSSNVAGTSNGSPAMFANTSAGQDIFGGGQMWGTGQTPSWSNDYTNQFASPGALGMTPSPAPVAGSVTSGRSSSITGDGLIPLHIGSIPTKSRVETQINIRMTIDRLPPGVTKIHLPTHTIAKAKLLNNDTPAKEETLELHAMLVCTSAMNNPKARENAMRKAAAQDNAEIQARGMAGGVKKEEPEELAEDDKPANGGEVRICTNCINRERKRAARKKLKKEEEQAHWERYETERVIVFNTNEYKAWLEWQQSPPQKESIAAPAPADIFAPSDKAMQITAPMRIACYCRHQSEKDGFQVIFTLKDYTGKVVAQAMSDSILITDDHKTHPITSMGSGVWYEGQGYQSQAFGSQSMVDMQSHMPAMTMSKSTGNLQSMGFGGAQGFHQSHSLHQMPAFPGGTTSNGTTPKNLSRPASPNATSHSAPNKKRKSTSNHRRVPSGLTMTKVDTSQPNAGSGLSALSGGTFSPTSAFTPNTENSFMGISQPSSRTSYPTQPPTPSDNVPFGYRNLNRTTSLDQTTFQAFYSAPNSAHQSRSGSPILHQGPNLAAFQRQHPSARNSANPFGMSSTPSSLHAQNSGNGSGNNNEEKPLPIINKVVPSEGPTAGGIEVSIYGQNFVPGMEVVFGDRTATATTYWGEKALCCVLPPASNLGPVHVGIVSGGGAANSSSASGRLGGLHSSAQAQVFRYTPDRDDLRMMEMALRFYSIKVTGSEDNWQSTAQDAANAWMSTAASAAAAAAVAADGGNPGGGGGGGGGGGQGQGQAGKHLPGAFPG